MASRNQRIRELAEDIVKKGEAAFSPQGDPNSRAAAVSEFHELIRRTKTLPLLPALTSLVQPGAVPDYLRPHVISALSLLPLRAQGVRSTIEFILSVHPTTQHHVENSPATPESKGAPISLDALNSASRLISSPPMGYPPEKWFAGISPQLLALIDGEGGLEMVKVASFIIGFGILGRREYGAPGAPGWKAFAEPILGKIDPTIGYDPSKHQIENISSTRSSYLLVTSSELADALRRLGSLLSSHPNPGLSKRLLSRLLLPIWSLASWPAEGTELEELRAPATYLLQVLLQLSLDGQALIVISQNLLYTGNDDSKSLRWSYKLCPQGGIQIEKRSSGIFGDFALEKPIDEQLIDRKADTLMAFMSPTADTDGVPKLFLSLCRKWLLVEDENSNPEIRLSASAQPEDTKELERKIVDAKIMQKMIELLPSRLVEESNQVLELASEVLFKASRSTEDIDNDETVPIALSLLNMIFTASSSRTLSENQPLYTIIKKSLEVISRKDSEVSSTARNILMLMEFQANETEFDEPAPVQDKSLEDRKTYKLAMSYITSSDSPTPVRAQGLDLLLKLISSNSPILDVPATMILISSLLQNEEEYIYLRAIKAYIQLSIKHPKAATKDIMERYFDANEELPLDARLRLGEALLQVIERLGKAFTGDSAQHIGTGLLALAGRRGYRPKTEEKKQKAAALQKCKNQEAEDAWSGEVPQIGEDEITEDDILRAQIVEGWEATRGEEDIRIRASALSIFGMAIEVNIAGLGSTLVSGGVDLSINILALEPEPEKGILRRSAILLVMSLIRALDKAQEEGKRLGFGLAGQSLDDVLRVLKYVQDTDNDGLVRQHAKDVVEELGVWQMKGLMGAGIRTEMPQQVGLEELAGLRINPSRSRTAEPDLGGRPRIEEIE